MPKKAKAKTEINDGWRALPTVPEGTECECDGCMSCGEWDRPYHEDGCGMPATKVTMDGDFMCEECGWRL